jgi:excisionase family DNA binding protein
MVQRKLQRTNSKTIAMAEEKIINVNPGDRIVINVKNEDSDNRSYSITEFAKLSGLSRSTINLKINNGEIPKIMVGKSPRIKAEYLNQFKKK